MYSVTDCRKSDKGAFPGTTHEIGGAPQMHLLIDFSFGGAPPNVCTYGFFFGGRPHSDASA